MDKSRGRQQDKDNKTGKGEEREEKYFAGG